MRTLLALTLSGSALTLLLLALRYGVFRRMPSTAYYYAWALVLLRFALPLPGIFPARTQAEAQVLTTYREAYSPDGGVLPFEAPLWGVPEAEIPDSPIQEPQIAVPQQTANAVTAPGASSAPLPRSAGVRLPELWLLIWALGAGIALGSTILSYLRFTHRIRRELRRPDRFTRELYAALPGRKPRLYVCPGIPTPLMFGVVSPRIVLPEREYSPELLRNVLLHELTHYRRFDTLYKWAAAAILSVHWFNPLSWLVRRELNRACELSCDEMLLRSMSRAEKQSYGDTLLAMAASAALPDRVVATTFVTQKRNLKERLEQIMNYKKSGARLLAAVLALVLLVGGALAAGPRAEAKNASPSEQKTVRVETVDEFLAAIGPNTVIELAEGAYDLATAADYVGKSGSAWYTWEPVPENGMEPGAELVISGVENLTIRGAGKEKTILEAVPRYANVLRFRDCDSLRVEELTAGHTTEPGFCAGGVLKLEDCRDVSVTGCGLFGCGTVGVDAAGTTGLTVTGCDIYECSMQAVNLSSSRDVRVEDCEIYRHGVRAGQGAAMYLFGADYSSGVVIRHNRIHDNAAQFLLRLSYSRNAAFLSNEVRDNRFGGMVFSFDQYGAAVDGCVFTDNDGIHSWVQSSGVYAYDVTGKLLTDEDFEAMELRDIDPEEISAPESVAPAAEVAPGGELTVSTVDEFLAAIGPERTIVLNADHLFDLSEAANYGAIGGEYYFWQASHDGPQLVIHGVDGLAIRSDAEHPEDTVLAAVPRYANVLCFRDCSDIALSNFTAGHTKEPGACSGGVLDFQNCQNITLEDMSLYGCGILGVQAHDCETMVIRSTEIFECSQGAGQLFLCRDVRFEDCDIHDVPSPAFRFRECEDVVWNGEACDGLAGRYDADTDGALVFLAEDNGPVTSFEGDAVRFTYPEGSPERAFAQAVKTAVADGDWKNLAEWVSYPLRVIDGEGNSLQIQGREEFIAQADDIFNHGFRETVANAPLDEFGVTLYGLTFCGHLLAFSSYLDEQKNVAYHVTVMSANQPLWPGEFPYVFAVPTPEV